MYQNERSFELYIRNLIRDHITSVDRRIYALENKSGVDIIVCRDVPDPKLFFIEAKYYKLSHARLAIGGGRGGGFQPEIVRKIPLYFETNLRWALASEANEPGKVLFLPSSILRQYISGQKVDTRYNNIQLRIFREQHWLTEAQFIQELGTWLDIAPRPSAAARHQRQSGGKV